MLYAKSTMPPSAHGVGLPGLALERVILIRIMWVIMRGLARVGNVLLDMFGVCSDGVLVHVVQGLQRDGKVADERIASGLREVFADDDAHQLELIRVRGHGVCGDDPAALTELVGNRELVVQLAVLRVEAEGYQGKAFTAAL